jgi:hypothetical protein
LLRRLKILVYELLGWTYPIGERTEPGWKGPLMFYRFKCPIHGYQESRLYGIKEFLVCPVCGNAKLHEENPIKYPRVNEVEK